MVLSSVRNEWMSLHAYTAHVANARVARAALHALATKVRGPGVGLFVSCLVVRVCPGEGEENKCKCASCGREEGKDY